jgi:hypothetical protein
VKPNNLIGKKAVGLIRPTQPTPLHTSGPSGRWFYFSLPAFFLKESGTLNMRAKPA